MFARIENPKLRGAAEWLVSIGLAALLVLFLREFVFRVANVDGNSMLPTLAHDDMVILDRLRFRFSSPQAGDIVAFPYAEDPFEFYIKRVVGVPGDIIDLRDGVFYINNEPLADDFSAEPTVAMGDVVFPVEVEEGRFFVLGDNRNGSQDSRFASVGTIPAENMVGRATVRIWPLGRIGGIE